MVRTKAAGPPARFTLESPLGVGGHGEVWLGYDNLLGRRVALKRVLAGSGVDGDHLRSEATLLARLNHPNIVAIYDLAEIEGDTYLVLEHVAGRSLRELLASGPLPEAQVAAIGVQLANALACAHEGGIVHNDVKPENILIDSAGNARLTDFGISRFDGNTLAPGEAREFFGTLAYIAPEVLQGAPPTAASDLYSLGVTLEEAATGARPPAPAGFARAGNGTQTSRLGAPLSPALAAALARATDPDPSLRFESAAAFSAALVAATTTRTERLVRPAPMVLPGRRAGRAGRVVGLGVALVGVGLLGAAAKLTWAGTGGNDTAPSPTATPQQAAVPAASSAVQSATPTLRPQPTATRPPIQQGKKPPGKNKNDH